MSLTTLFEMSDWKYMAFSWYSKFLSCTCVCKQFLFFFHKTLCFACISLIQNKSYKNNIFSPSIWQLISTMQITNFANCSALMCRDGYQVQFFNRHRLNSANSSDSRKIKQYCVLVPKHILLTVRGWKSRQFSMLDMGIENIVLGLNLCIIIICY